MAGLKGNVAWWAAAKQSAKGAIASYAPVKVPFTGGGLQVTRETANLSETDSSRDQGVTYVSRSGVEGGTESYVRDSYIHTLLEATLGKRTVVASGTQATLASGTPPTAAAATTATITAAAANLNTYTYTTSAAHNLAVGDNINITNVATAVTTGTATSGAGQTTITLASATGVVAGQTVTGTGIPAGTTVTSITSTTLVISQATNASWVSGGSLSFSGNNFYNGNFNVASVPTTSTFTVVGNQSSNVATSGVLAGTATRTLAVYTYTTTAAHNLTVGTTVGIQGVSIAAFNGLFQILTVPSSTTFTVVGPASPGTPTVSSGTVSTSGTHTITPTDSLGLPYYTFWRNQSDTLYESFTDCQVSELTIKGEAGSPLSASTSIMGITPTRSATETAATSWNTKVVNDAVYNYNNAQVAIGGTVSAAGIVTSPTITTLVSSVEVQVSNNLSVQQTDDVAPLDMVVGSREINISFDLILDTLDEYNKFFYGSATGTAVSSSIYTTPMQFRFVNGSNSIQLDFPSVAYEAFPVEPNPNGDPIVVSVRAQAQRTGDALRPIMTATVVNANLL